jgi:Icc protein
MLIAQITDLHIGFEPGNPEEFNQRRLDQVIQAITDGPNRPDVLLATGDLTDLGDADSYRRCAETLNACPFPVYPCLGNHDDRSNFAAQFPHIPMPDGFAQYAVMLDGLRLVVIDTLEVGRHGGGFCEIRAAWLRATLDEDRETPTLIVMHHPPFEAGIDWMNTHPDEPWVRRFSDAIAGHGQIQAVLCGHIHRAIAAPWKGVTVTVCPATAPQLTLDLNPIDPEMPDDRSMVIADPPAYAIHRWTSNGLVTLFETAENHTVLAKFDNRMQPLIRELVGERPIS